MLRLSCSSLPIRTFVHPIASRQAPVNTFLTATMANPTGDHGMKYRFLGNTGLLVSQLSFGSWVTLNDEVDFELVFGIVKRAYEMGINFFDNAEAYGNGKSEEVFGKIVEAGVSRGVWEREDLVISTKLFGGAGKSGPNDKGLSRKHVIEGMKGSLKRMNLEYVDVVFCHRRDPYTSIEETVRGMNFLIDQGYTFYWGTSEWHAQDVIEACEIADRLGMCRPCYDQTQYSILERSRVDFEYQPLYAKYGYGLTTWSPLAFGILTGKYNNGIPEGSRLSKGDYEWLMNDVDSRIDKARKLEPIAKEVGCTMAQLAIAYCASNEHVSTVILGASNVKQLDENLKAMQFIDKITPEVREKIETAVDTQVKALPQHDPNALQIRQQWLQE